MRFPYVPKGHVVQDAALPLLYVPGPHTVEGLGGPPLMHPYPAGHTPEQLELTLPPVPYNPAGHTEQTVPPVLYLPTGHRAAVDTVLPTGQ